MTDSQSGYPIVGAMVVVSGTNNAAITDASGVFTIEAAQGSTLVATFLGYGERQVAVTGTTVNIALTVQSFEVEEVVVVGTVMRKSDLTGAVGGVSAKVLAEKPVTSVNQALQGRLGGVFITQGAKPTDEASIRIRGINTMDGSTDPIYVVDGVIMDNWYGGFSATNVSDIASVEVLKDASATALYGSRGANGVVVITTKKGQTGEGMVTYDSWVGIQTFGYEPGLMNTRQLYDTRRQAYINGFTESYRNRNMGRMPSEAEVQGYIDSDIGTLTNNPGRVFTTAETNALSEGRSYNWLDEIRRRTGVQQNHVLSYSGASDRGSMYLSFGYNDNKGLIEKTRQTRHTGRINVDYKIKKYLTVGTNTFNSKVDDNVFGRARGASPFLEPNDVDLYTAWNAATNNDFNPIRTLRIDDHERLNRLTTSNFVNIEIIKGLNVRSTFAADHVSLKNCKKHYL